MIIVNNDDNNNYIYIYSCEDMKNGHKFQLPPARNKGEEGGSKEVQGLRLLAPK